MISSRLLRKLNSVVVLMTTSNSPFSTAAIFVAAGAWHRVFKEFHRMKKAMICALLSLTMVCCGTVLFAQTQDSSGQGAMSQGGMHRMPMSTDERLAHLTQMLNLTSDQQTKIRPMLDNESQQMQTLRQDSSMSREDKMTKMRSIRESTMSQITPVLTPDQQKKWQDMQSQHMGHQGMAPQAVPPPQQ
jgi:Spy/CpxP family protein refolding chaperone